MAIKEFTYRQGQSAVLPINCLMEPEGAFAHLSDVIHLRVARLAHEIGAALRQYEAFSAPRRMEYALREPSEDGKKGALVHPKRAGTEEPDRGQFVIDPDRMVDYQAMIQAALDETFQIDVKEIRATDLRREITVDGKKELRIPAGWWTTDGPKEGVCIKQQLGPAGILMGLEPFLVMDLDTES